jgi:hypothetical protein
VGELILPASLGEFSDTKGDASFGKRKRGGNRRNGNAAHTSQDGPKTAGWQDLLKYAMVPFEISTSCSLVLCRLVTLQSVILDTEESLSDIVREIDKELEGDVTAMLVSSPFERVFGLLRSSLSLDMISNSITKRNAKLRSVTPCWKNCEYRTITSRMLRMTVGVQQ